MLEKKRRFTSVLLLARIPTVSALVESTKIVSAVSNTGTKNDEHKGITAKITYSQSSFGLFFYGIKDYLDSAIFWLSEKPQEKVKNSIPNIALPVPEDFVSTIIVREPGKNLGKIKEVCKIQDDDSKKTEEVPKKKKKTSTKLKRQYRKIAKHLLIFGKAIKKKFRGQKTIASIASRNRKSKGNKKRNRRKK